MISSTQGWAFKSSLSLQGMKTVFDEQSKLRWIWGDSHYHGDYLGARPYENVVLRIYSVESGFIVNLSYVAMNDDVTAANNQIANGEQTLHETILPMILARDIMATDPVE